jgi:hypothetical protein
MVSGAGASGGGEDGSEALGNALLDPGKELIINVFMDMSAAKMRECTA